VIVGDYHSILIPDLSHYRVGIGRLRGLRCIHTHLKGEPISEEDLTDLALLRLDAMVVLSVKDGYPEKVEMAYLLPSSDDKRWDIICWDHPSKVDIEYTSFIRDIEDQLSKAHRAFLLTDKEERAILVSATLEGKWAAERSLRELKALAESSNIEVLDCVFQRVSRYDPTYLIGKGKLRELMIKSLNLGATMLIFDQELTPLQVNNIADLVDLKVIDRTQLILDIFARRAKSFEGKIQVELAQLRYTLPRLVGKGTAMSRLAGGIGGRGPGETKLEVDRRKVKERISTLEKRLKWLEKSRKERRKKRQKSDIPIVAIVGYTNAGKSTLLNALTKAGVLTEDKLFATLDPTNRVLVLPGGTRCIISDTVGFIKKMPKELKVAFKATLEELEDASLLLHVVDATSPYLDEEIAAVHDMLKELNIEDKPRILVYNKIDLLGDNSFDFSSLAISAKEGINLDMLLSKIEEKLSYLSCIKQALAAQIEKKELPQRSAE